MKENIARITVNPETKQVFDIHFYERNVRFKCKKCAIYCCKLGGPSLTKKDVDKIESVGYDTSEFTEFAKRRYGSFPVMPNAITNKKDGSCIFLRMGGQGNGYECLVYDVRPVLCRLYPFEFEKINSNSFLLKIIPCCNGLNNPDGELVNERFIAEHLIESIYAIL